MWYVHAYGTNGKFTFYIFFFCFFKANSGDHSSSHCCKNASIQFILWFLKRKMNNWSTYRGFTNGKSKGFFFGIRRWWLNMQNSKKKNLHFRLESKNFNICFRNHLFYISMNGTRMHSIKYIEYPSLEPIWINIMHEKSSIWYSNPNNRTVFFHFLFDDSVNDEGFFYAVCNSMTWI